MHNHPWTDNRTFTLLWAAAPLLLVLPACESTRSGHADYPVSSLKATRSSDPSAADAVVAQAEETPYGPKAGDWEVTLGATGVNDEDFNAGSASGAASVGFFLTDHLEVVGRQNIAYFDAGDNQPTAWNGLTRVALDYHIPFGPVVPFIGGNFGVVYGESVDETLTAAPEVGVKWYVKEGAFVQGMVEYQFFFDSSNDIDDGFENGSFVYGVGIGLMF